MKSSLSKFGNLFCNEPYRIFFPLGVLAGAIGASHWLFYALGWAERYSGFFHSAIQMKCYMMCFVVGFLMTAIPRFASAPTATGREVLIFILLIFINISFLFRENWIGSESTFIAYLVFLARFIVVRFINKKGNVSPPTEFVWIGIGIVHGIIGSSMVLLGQFSIGPVWFAKAGKAMSEQGFLLSVVVGVGGFLAPRLMGNFSLIKPEEVRKLAQDKKTRRNRVFIHLTAGLILFGSFWLEGMNQMQTAYLIRALVVTFELVFTRVLPRFPVVKTLFSWLLWISMWMVLAGSWAAGLLIPYRIGMLHIVFIGGYALMTFTIGTMVVLSHGGEGPKLQRPIFILKLVGLGMLAALAIRIAANFTAEHYFAWLGAVAAMWLVVGAGWLCFAVPKIMKIPAEGEFERQHEEAKRKLHQPC